MNSALKISLISSLAFLTTSHFAAAKLEIGNPNPPNDRPPFLILTEQEKLLRQIKRNSLLLDILKRQPFQFGAPNAPAPVPAP